MILYLDTANVDDIRRAVSWGAIQGVTTNPSLVSREGRDFHQVIREIAGIVDGPVSAEVISTDTAGMVKEARVLHSLANSVVVKIPMTREGMAAVKTLSEEAISTNVTLVFSANQALLAARAGATFVSPFVGRLDDIGQNGIALVRQITNLFDVHNLQTRVIAASIRHPRHVIEAALAGAHVATVPFKVLNQMFQHPLTDIGLERFLRDWEEMTAKHDK